MKSIHILTNLVIIISLTALQAQGPKLSIIFVIDQMREDTLEAVYPYLKGGLKTLCDQGIMYRNAYVPHAMPSTAPGHAGMATGTTPKHHGIIGNIWYDAQGNKIKADQDDRPSSRVFSPDGLYNYGVSAINMKTDTVSDQLIHANKKNKAFALSLKSRSAVMPAGQTGKAIWIDPDEGTFTSSRAYFESLPTWISKVNQQYAANIKKLPIWKLQYPKSHPAYQLTERMEYTYAGAPTLINVKPTEAHRKDEDENYELFLRTPAALTFLFDGLKELLKVEYINSPETNDMLIWVGATTFDKLGHTYGPRSLEYIDLIYKFDMQLQQFFAWMKAEKIFDATLIGLTSDHGGAEIPELLQQEGLKAVRVNSDALIKELNTTLEQEFGIAGIVSKIKMFSLYCNPAVMKQISPEQRQVILHCIIDLLQQKEYVKSAWTFAELQNINVEKDDIVYNFQQQLYQGRSGEILIQVAPYAYLSPHKTGTGHRSPYHYDTHVPLILYSPKLLSAQKICSKVYNTQLAPTLAALYGISKPASASFEILPGVPCQLKNSPTR